MDKGQEVSVGVYNSQGRQKIYVLQVCGKEMTREKITDKNWAKFMKWLQEKRHLSMIYTPDKYSIKLWKEFEDDRTSNL